MDAGSLNSGGSLATGEGVDESTDTAMEEVETAEASKQAEAVEEDKPLTEDVQQPSSDVASSSVSLAAIHALAEGFADDHRRAPQGDESTEFMDAGSIAADAAAGLPPWRAVKTALQHLGNAEVKALEKAAQLPDFGSEDAIKRLGPFSYARLSQTLLEEPLAMTPTDTSYREARLTMQNQERFLQELEGKEDKEATEMCLERAKVGLDSSKDDLLVWLGYLHPHLKEKV